MVIIPVIRKPRKSEMALSTQVKEAVDQASNCLRDALAFAARTEHPLTVSTISDLLCRLESLEQVDELMAQFSKRDGEKQNPYRG
jgi:hypothetical protein